MILSVCFFVNTWQKLSTAARREIDSYVQYLQTLTWSHSWNSDWCEVEHSCRIFVHPKVLYRALLSRQFFAFSALFSKFLRCFSFAPLGRSRRGGRSTGLRWGDFGRDRRERAPRRKPWVRIFSLFFRTFWDDFPLHRSVDLAEFAAQTVVVYKISFDIAENEPLEVLNPW